MSTQFADPYQESYEEVEVESFSRSVVYDIEYRAHKKTRTVRSVSATPWDASYGRNIPEGFYAFYDDGDRYALNPEERVLMKLNNHGHNRTIAEGDEIVKMSKVSYPGRVPVGGSPQEDVEATIYYRSPLSDNMQELTVQVDSFMDNYNIDGEDEDGNRIEAHLNYERDILRSKGAKKRHLGKVARVEFPRGHTFQVSIENLPNEDAEDFCERIEKGINREVHRADEYEITVEHTGEMEY